MPVPYEMFSAFAAFDCDDSLALVHRNRDDRYSSVFGGMGRRLILKAHSEWFLIPIGGE